MVTTVLWRRLDQPGHEICTLRSLNEEWSLSGTAIFAEKSGPCKLDYRILCSADWQTRTVDLFGVLGGNEIQIEFSVDSHRVWYRNGVVCSAVSECIDIDLGFTPATNLLPIRRLGLAVGESAEVRAAWLPFPALHLEPLTQNYRREAEDIYRYESRGGQYVAKLTVNRAGFVTHYPHLCSLEAGS